MTNLKLTEHFNLIEFERSTTATANNIDNTCPSQFIPALVQICKTILEPLRAFAGQQIIIGSGYRCNQLNIKVGGVYASQHTLGEAADIQIPKTPYTEWSDSLAHTDKQILNTWFDWLITITFLNCLPGAFGKVQHPFAISGGFWGQMMVLINVRF